MTDTTLKLLNTRGQTTEIVSNAAAKLYICGPTVYDDCHMGHARTYVTADIMTRIISDFFHKDLTVCMNITDVDDKIIAKSKEHASSRRDHTGTLPEQQIAEVKAVANVYETKFWECLAKLGCRPPHNVVKVSDFIPQMLEIVKTLTLSPLKLAYETPHGVYFSLQAYRRLGFTYPIFKHNEPASLSSESHCFKRDSNDFCIWKTGELFWDSPYGYARPGWHLECAALSFAVFGTCLDFHIGGMDLKFPHHDNEIAVAQAYKYATQHSQNWPVAESQGVPYPPPESCYWANHFLHIGQLTIKNCKMSKSLRNFVTVDQVLSRFSETHVRILMLAHPWHKSVQFSWDSLEEAKSKEAKIQMFLKQTVDLERAHPRAQHGRSIERTDINKMIFEKLAAVKLQNREFLANNLNYTDVFSSTLKLIDMYGAHRADVFPQTALSIREYVKSVLRLFGLKTDAESAKNTELIFRCIDHFMEFRKDVKNMALQCLATESTADGSLCHSILDSCDKVREKLATTQTLSIHDTKVHLQDSWNFIG